MKKISVEFVINNKTIDIGQALIETDVPQLLGKRKRTQVVLNLPPVPTKRSNRIIIPRTVLAKSVDPEPEQEPKKRRGRQKKVQFQEESINEPSVSLPQSQQDPKFSEDFPTSHTKTEDWDEDEVQEDGDEEGEDEDALEFENDLELDLSEEKEEEEGEEEEEDEFKEEEDMPKKLTKRQQISKLKQLKEQGQGEEFEESIDIESYHMQLPDKKPRKKRNALMTEEQQIKKLEKEEKRKINTLRQIEEHKQQTVDKILNETGRMQKQRKEKEDKNSLKINKHVFHSLPSTDTKIRYLSSSSGEFIFLDKTLPSGNWLLTHELSLYGGRCNEGNGGEYEKEKGRKCFNCGNYGKYKKTGGRLKEEIFFCSVGCSKKINDEFELKSKNI